MECPGVSHPALAVYLWEEIPEEWRERLAGVRLGRAQWLIVASSESPGFVRAAKEFVRAMTDRGAGVVEVEAGGEVGYCVLRVQE